MDSRYTLRVLHEPDRAAWDRFVEENPDGDLLQSWAWGELKGSFNWQPLRVALYEGDQIVAGAQVLRRGAPHLPLQLGHIAYVPKGPVIDWSQPALVKTFFTHLHRLLRGQGATAVRIEPNVTTDTPLGEPVMEHLGALSFRPTRTVQPIRTIKINLEPDEQTLLANMKRKWRYNIHLAERDGVKVRTATSLDEVNTWYKLYQKTSERAQFGIHDLDYYQRVWELFAPSEQVRLLLAEREGELLAGMFVVFFSHQACSYYGASSHEHRQLMPNHALHWDAIRRARQLGLRRYDFWGIAPTDSPDEPLAGVYHFKSGWGGQVVRFVGCYEFSYHPLVMRLARRWLPAGG